MRFQRYPFSVASDYVSVFISMRFHLSTPETMRFQKAPLLKPFLKVFVFISVSVWMKGENAPKCMRFQSDSNFSILHLNVRSLRNKVDDLALLLANLNIKFTVIGISETWLQNEQHDVDIIGYEFIRKNRPDRSSGGVGLYLSNNLDFYFMRDDLSVSDADVMESLFIEIVRSNEKNIC